MSVELTIPVEAIPDEAYPPDAEARSQCKKYEETLTRFFVFVKRFNTFDDTKAKSRSGDLENKLRFLRRIYIDYLILCEKHKAISLVYLMRQMVKRSPESGVTWYSLALALIVLDEPDPATKEELSECLAKANKYGCEYVTRDTEGKLIIRMLWE